MKEKLAVLLRDKHFEMERKQIPPEYFFSASKNHWEALAELAIKFVEENKG